MRRATHLLVLVLLASGCSRASYRRAADHETYHAIAQHSDETRWPIVSPNITPPPQSRLFDPFDPDHPPMPPDDPAAYRFMMRPNGVRGSRHFHDDGDAPFIEDPDWRAHLPLNADGKLQLTPDGAVELGLLNSREYHNQLDNLYLTALALTLNRFEFDCHWFLTNDTLWTHFGSSATEVNTLDTTTAFGFTRNLYAGGQLLVEFVNSFLITFSGVNQTVATSNIIATLTQPLLRGAGRRVRMEALTQAERNVLYAVRTFARFRKQFYVTLTSAQRGGYLALLLQVQNVRDLEADVRSQEQNLRMHEALFKAESVSTIQVDQALQSYLQSKLALLQAQTSLETSLDNYKFTLGLPPSVPVALDDALLKPFQLAAPELEQLQGEVDRFFADVRERDQAPTLAELRAGFDKLGTFRRRGEALLDRVAAEMREWQGRLGTGTSDPALAERERESYRSLERQLPDIRTDFAELAKGLAQDAAALDDAQRKKGWDALQNRSRQLIAQLAQLFVLETQVRVYLIRLRPIPYRLEEASEFARQNRLDLLNERARVVDAWRQVAVTANALRAGLNVTASANVATQPLTDAPFDFRASASTYTVGFQFDAPLNRLAERNAYRASQVAYEEARRNFMGLEDQVDAQVRQDLRTLEQERTNFDIGRLALVTAARQVEASRDRLLLVERAGETTTTLDILNALSALLQAKSRLIGSWTNYESARLQLLLDMEALQVTPRGIPADEPDHDASTLPAPRPLFPAPGTDG